MGKVPLDLLMHPCFLRLVPQASLGELRGLRRVLLLLRRLRLAPAVPSTAGAMSSQGAGSKVRRFKRVGCVSLSLEKAGFSSGGAGDFLSWLLAFSQSPTNCLDGLVALHLIAFS